MAFPSLGPLNQIVENFTKSLNDIFGGGQSQGTGKMAIATQLVNPEGTLSADTGSFNPNLWTGNTNRKGDKRLRYGFKILDISQFGTDLQLGANSKSTSQTYYLDIPPQAISQKEVFATNVTATRRGVVVESEGVVFKDIVIAGTTGVFPGQRDTYGGQQLNQSLTSAPTQAGGVQENGTSKGSTVISGYAEFMALRAFFLKYSQTKIASNGRKFLLFINEKDQQALVVEPLEFTMERSSKNPMQYQYRIVLKCLTTLDSAFASDLNGAKDPGDILNDIVNVSRNAVAAIQQFRAVVGQTNRLIQSVSQEIDKTFIQPLRLLGTALNDVAEGRANVLAVPTVLSRNLNEAILGIQENRFTKSSKELAALVISTGVISTSTTSGSVTANNSAASGKISTRGSTDALTSTNLLNQAKADNYVSSTVNSLETSTLDPMSKSFVQSLKDQAQSLADDCADAVNLGNSDYDAIQNRTPTIIANSLRQPTSSEYLLLGATLNVIAALNQVLSTNNLFLVSTQTTFENDQAALQNIVNLQVPSSAREITIMQGDTLERISLREYGTVTRWVEIAVLNNLKYPYISDSASDGVKTYGNKLLVGN